MISKLEKVALVQCYIHYKKDIEVKIKTPITRQQHHLLDLAYSSAIKYFR